MLKVVFKTYTLHSHSITQVVIKACVLVPGFDLLNLLVLPSLSHVLSGKSDISPSDTLLK